jgi:hypothetical protein
MNITSHVIVGTLPGPEAIAADRSSPTIVPPHPSATRTPFRQHPSIAPSFPLPGKLTFTSGLKWSVDEIVEERYLAQAINPLESNGGFDSAECQLLFFFSEIPSPGLILLYECAD